MSRFQSFLGRLSVAVLLTLLGGIAGLVIGLCRGITAAKALPPSPATMGFESAGFAPAIVVAINLALGAAGGAVVGLVIGVAGALFWSRGPK